MCICIALRYCSLLEFLLPSYIAWVGLLHLTFSFDRCVTVPPKEGAANDVPRNNHCAATLRLPSHSILCTLLENMWREQRLFRLPLRIVKQLSPSLSDERTLTKSVSSRRCHSTDAIISATTTAVSSGWPDRSFVQKIALFSLAPFDEHGAASGFSGRRLRPLKRQVHCCLEINATALFQLW